MVHVRRKLPQLTNVPQLHFLSRKAKLSANAAFLAQNSLCFYLEEIFMC